MGIMGWIGFGLLMLPLMIIVVAYKERSRNYGDKELELVMDAFAEHCGLDPNYCIKCGGPPHSEGCVFRMARDTLRFCWKEGNIETKNKMIQFWYMVQLGLEKSLGSKKPPAVRHAGLTYDAFL